MALKRRYLLSKSCSTTDQLHCKCWAHVPQPSQSPRRDAKEWLAYRKQRACETLAVICTYLSTVSWWQWFYPKMKADGEKYTQRQPPVLWQGHGVNPALKSASCRNLKFPALQTSSLGDEQGPVPPAQPTVFKARRFLLQEELQHLSLPTPLSPDSSLTLILTYFLTLDTVSKYWNGFRNRAMRVNAPALHEGCTPQDTTIINSLPQISYHLRSKMGLKLRQA